MCSSEPRRQVQIHGIATQDGKGTVTGSWGVFWGPGHCRNMGNVGFTATANTFTRQGEESPQTVTAETRVEYPASTMYNYFCLQSYGIAVKRVIDDAKSMGLKNIEILSDSDETTWCGARNARGLMTPMQLCMDEILDALASGLSITFTTVTRTDIEDAAKLAEGAAQKK